MLDQSDKALRNKTSLGVLAVALTAPLLAGGLTTPHAAAAVPSTVDPPAGRFVVQSINGTGCRAADTQVTTRGLGRLNVNFGALQARTGGGAPATAARANCVVSVRASAPRGYTFGVDNILVRGRASLPADAVGTASASFWFVGRTDTATTDRTVPGPYIATWDLRRVVRPASIAWMPCRANYPINLNIAVAVRGGARAGAPASMTIGDGTNEPSASYRFAWKRC
ncbi:DUF4360 domain-containing protein [Cryptosporangium minutisporangium]|uniref:DUF4360 domain-containing protein n=1 Tax=Cryptosporangium minutisporangium TaxID=113569 RepID=A0ABP6T0J9_9ACTN